MIVSLNLICITLAFSSVMIAIEIIKRRFSLPVYVTRKIAHIAASLNSLVAAWLLSQAEIIILCILSVITLLIARRMHTLSSVHDTERKTMGDLYLPIGALISALLFLPQDIGAFQFGVLIMGFSDGLAGLVGEAFGKHRLKFLSRRKTVEGTLTFFVISLILTFLFMPSIGYQVIVIPAVLTAAEYLLVYGLDNLVLPVLAAYLMHLFI